MTNVASENSKSRNAQDAEAGAPMSTQLPKVSSSDFDTAKCKGIEGAHIVIEPTDIILPAPKRTIRLRLEAMDDQGVVDAYKGGKALTNLALAELRVRFDKNKKLDAPGFEACKVWDDALKILGIPASTARRRIAKSGVKNPAAKHAPKKKPQPKTLPPAPDAPYGTIMNPSTGKSHPLPRFGMVTTGDRTTIQDRKTGKEIGKVYFGDESIEASIEVGRLNAADKPAATPEADKPAVQSQSLDATYWVIRNKNGEFFEHFRGGYGRSSWTTRFELCAVYTNPGTADIILKTLRERSRKSEREIGNGSEIIRVDAVYTLTPVTEPPEPKAEPEAPSVFEQADADRKLIEDARAQKSNKRGKVTHHYDAGSGGAMGPLRTLCGMQRSVMTSQYHEGVSKEPTCPVCARKKHDQDFEAGKPSPVRARTLAVTHVLDPENPGWTLCPNRVEDLTIVQSDPTCLHCQGGLRLIAKQAANHTLTPVAPEPPKLATDRDKDELTARQNRNFRLYRNHWRNKFTAEKWRASVDKDIARFPHDPLWQQCMNETRLRMESCIADDLAHSPKPEPEPRPEMSVFENAAALIAKQGE